jgi:FeS assembly SUF system protein
MPEPINLPSTSTTGPLNSIQQSLLEGEVIETLRTIYDPELPVNIYDLGLIYGITVNEFAHVDVDMTLTSPACPVAESLPGEVEEAIRQTPGVSQAKINLIWDPPYSMDMMPDHVKLELGLF